MYIVIGIATKLSNLRFKVELQTWDCWFVCLSYSSIEICGFMINMMMIFYEIDVEWLVVVMGSLDRK